MLRNDYLQLSVAIEPSWGRAAEILSKRIFVQAHVWSLIKSAWFGQTDMKHFFKVMGFSRLNPACLLDAAGTYNSEALHSGASVERAILTLGMRFSSVVLGVNYVCRTVLKSNPPPIWKSVFHELMTNVEIGYRVGAKSHELGLEGGALIGFSTIAGELLLLAEYPKEFKKWRQNQKKGDQLRHSGALDIFGCEPYQLSALLLQSLGYGSELAIGVALGAGGLEPQKLDISHEHKRWRAAYLWIEALKDGRNYPAEVESRQFFSEITPPNPGSNQGRNVSLEVLYTEVGKVRHSGSCWTWHLPTPKYLGVPDSLVPEDTDTQKASKSKAK